MKNYKLFGKINIIDLLAVLIIIVAIVFVYFNVFSKTSNDGMEDITITFTTTEVSDFVVSKLANENSAKNVAAFIDEKTAFPERIHEQYRIGETVFEKLDNGCRMYDDTKKAELGNLTSIRIGNSDSKIAKDGEWFTATKPDYSHLELTSTVRGLRKENGFEIGGETYYIGDYIVLRAGITKIYIQITGFDIAD